MQEFLTPHQVKEVAGVVRSLVGGLDPDYVTAREAPELYETFDQISRLANAAKLMLARRIDESDVARAVGLRNGAEWIARTTGISPSAGYEQVAASKRVAKQPVVAAALKRGELSPNQAQSIAGAADVDPAAEERLVGLAQSTSLGELRTECARTKAAGDPDPEKTYERIRQGRRLRTHRDEEGAWRLNGSGPIDAGAEVETTLRAIADEIFAEARENGVHETRDAYLFDALVEMARRAWHWMHRERTVAPDSAVEAPRERNRKPGVNPRLRAVLRADLAAIVRGRVEGDEVCEIAGLGPVPVARARELLGESILDLVLTKGQGVATTVGLGRGPNASQKVALLWQSLECSRLGCGRPATQYDHRDPYANCKVTELRNLDGLCDHDLKTYEGWALVPGTGKREMVPPGDPRHPGNPTFHERRTSKAA